MAQSMNVDCAAALVSLVDLPLVADFEPPGDTGQHQIAVENPHQPGWNVEQRRIWWQFRHGYNRLTQLPLGRARIALFALVAGVGLRVKLNRRRTSGGLPQ